MIPVPTGVRVRCGCVARRCSISDGKSSTTAEPMAPIVSSPARPATRRTRRGRPTVKTLWSRVPPALQLPKVFYAGNRPALAP